MMAMIPCPHQKKPDLAYKGVPWGWECHNSLCTRIRRDAEKWRAFARWHRTSKGQMLTPQTCVECGEKIYWDWTPKPRCSTHAVRAARRRRK